MMAGYFEVGSEQRKYQNQASTTLMHVYLRF